jgi:ribosome biogenesis protein ENP2
MVPIRPQTIGSNSTQRPGDKDATFGQRRMPRSTNTTGKSSFRAHEDDDAMEISWVPTSSSSATGEKDNGDRRSKSRDKVRKGIETFGAGLERGVEERMEFSNDSERKGRSHRRKGVRSGSKNTFRRL